MASQCFLYSGRPLQGKVLLKSCSNKEKNRLWVGVSELQLSVRLKAAFQKKHDADLESQQEDICRPGLCTILALPDTVEQRHLSYSRLSTEVGDLVFPQPERCRTPFKYSLLHLSVVLLTLLVQGLSAVETVALDDIKGERKEENTEIAICISSPISVHIDFAKEARSHTFQYSSFSIWPRKFKLIQNQMCMRIEYVSPRNQFSTVVMMIQ